MSEVGCTYVHRLPNKSLESGRQLATIIKVTNIVFELVNVIVESASINGKH